MTALALGLYTPQIVSAVLVCREIVKFIAPDVLIRYLGHLQRWSGDTNGKERAIDEVKNY